MKTIIFDMFSTLVDPRADLEPMENACLGVSSEVWKACLWEPSLVRERALGLIKTDRELTERACAKLPFRVTEQQLEALRLARNERMRITLCGVRPEILQTLSALREAGYQIGLVSNADVVDILFWENCPLKPLFDDVIYSCNVGLAKPDEGIYRLAMEHLHCLPEEVLYVGDGGDEELRGAKAVGFHTVWTEYFRHRGEEERGQIAPFADYHTDCFTDLPQIAAEYFRDT